MRKKRLHLMTVDEVSYVDTAANGEKEWVVVKQLRPGSQDGASGSAPVEPAGESSRRVVEAGLALAKFAAGEAAPDLYKSLEQMVEVGKRGLSQPTATKAEALAPEDVAYLLSRIPVNRFGRVA